MKKFKVYIDISEIMSVEANSDEEAVTKALSELEQSETVWYPSEADLFAEEVKDD